MHAQQRLRRYRFIRPLLLATAAVLALAALIIGFWIARTVPMPWREGIRNVGQNCTQRFAGTPRFPAGADVSVATERSEVCGYAYAIQTENSTSKQYVLALGSGKVDAGSTVLVSLSAYDGWRRLDRVRRRIEGPANLKDLQLAVDVSPRATLVEVVTSVRGGGGYSLQGMTLLPSKNAMTPGKHLYLEAMDVIAANALNAGKLPPNFAARWQPADDATAGEARQAIGQVLTALDDGHSFLLDPDRLAAMPRQERSVFRLARFKLLERGVGYVEVPGFLGNDPALRARYTASITDALQAGTRAGVRGWVVDLRDNGGGNMWPMLAGLEPLLRNQTLGWFQRRDGSRRAWRNDVTDGAAQVKDLGQLPVAVLTSRTTASSGEAVVVAFQGRPGTRRFGMPTRGLSTGNAGYPLKDGTVLQLTTTSFVDRAQHVYGGPIPPDERSLSPSLSDGDEVAAKRWLQTQLDQ
ncbi:MAG: S41 family peptidase [Stenotrophomonas sp.]|uniref:S41 family peptidase n=1 Tax=Stenotrophomonas sp. TaxID=69392 RepID=UPI003D6CABD6